MDAIQKTGMTEQELVMLALIHASDRMQETLNKRYCQADDEYFAHIYTMKQAFDALYEKYMKEDVENV